MTATREPLHRAEDELLLAQVLHRDERAWQELLRRFRPLMLRCILRTLHRHQKGCGSDEASEIFAEVCLALLRDDMHKLRLYQPGRGTRLSSWLGLLSSHAASDHLRRKSRRLLFTGTAGTGRQEDADPLSQLSAEGPSALEQLLLKEDWAWLRRSLAVLSARDRCFVELFYGEGLRADEVAARMGISLKTVYSKKNKLRTRLAAQCRCRARISSGLRAPEADSVETWSICP